MFQNDAGEKGRKNQGFYGMDGGMKLGMMPMHMGYQMYQNPMYPMPPYPNYYPQPYFYDQNYFKGPEEGEMYQQGHNQPPVQQTQENENNNFHDFLKDVLAVDKDVGS
jgi:hypothetical protein